MVNGNRIVWTSNERSKLAEKTFEIRKSERILSTMQAFNKAQPLVLNKDRIRKITALTVVPWLEDELSAIERVERNTAPKQPNPLVEVNPPEIKPIEVELPIMTQLVSKPVPVIVESAVATTSSGINDFDDSVIITEFFKRLMAGNKDTNQRLDKLAVEVNELKQLLNGVLPLVDLLEELTKQKTPPPPPPVKKKKVILLVGLKPNQFNEVKSEFEDEFDIRFWSKDESYDKLKSMCANADKIFGMADFMSHSYDNVINNVNKKAYTSFKGSTSTLKKLIRQLPKD